MAIPSTSYFPLTGDRLVDAITNGSYWSVGADRTIYWSISNGFVGEFWNNPGIVAQYVGNALAVYSYYANVNFVYKGFFTTPSSAYQAGSDINVSLDGSFHYTTNTNVWAIGYFPNINWGDYQGAPGDIFLNINSLANSLPSYDPGSAGWELLLHELGHTLGLKHPHDGGDTGRPTLTSLGLGQLDIDWFSVMSYRDDFDFNLVQFDAATPQVLDVIGLQSLYGINWSSNVGNGTYPRSTTNCYYTVWDAGGVDQVDASGSTTGWTIYLPNVQLSALVTQKFGLAVPTIDLQLSSPLTLAWLEGDIENAIGSSFADEIHGNDLANVLTGGLGNDYLDGGAGQDTAIFSGAKSQYTITSTASGHILTGPDGVDTLVGVELAQFSDGIINLGGSPPVVPTLATIETKMWKEMNGANPTDAQLSAWAKIHTDQAAFAQKIGVGSVNNAVFEAFGLGFSDQSKFRSEFGTNKFGLSDNAGLIKAMWNDAFNKASVKDPTDTQIAFVQKQLDFHTTIYDQSNAFGHDPAAIANLARGAVYGVVIGIADDLGHRSSGHNGTGVPNRDSMSVGRVQNSLRWDPLFFPHRGADSHESSWTVQRREGTMFVEFEDENGKPVLINVYHIVKVQEMGTRVQDNPGNQIVQIVLSVSPSTPLRVKGVYEEVRDEIREAAEGLTSLVVAGT